MLGKALLVLPEHIEKIFIFAVRNGTFEKLISPPENYEQIIFIIMLLLLLCCTVIGG